MELFSNGTSTSVILRFWDITLKDKSLSQLLLDLASSYTLKYYNLQPTYAQHSAFYLRKRYYYSIQRFLSLYDLNDEQSKECYDFALKLSESLTLIEGAKRNRYFSLHSLKENV